MCANKNHDNQFMNGLVFGAIIGLAAGVLFAPDKGEETRKKVKKAKLDAEAFVAEKKQHVMPLVNELETVVAPMLAKAKIASAPVKEQILEKIVQLVDEAELLTEDAIANVAQVKNSISEKSSKKLISKKSTKSVAKNLFKGTKKSNS